MPAHDFVGTFAQLKQILEPFEARLLVKKDSPDEYSLDTRYSEKWKRDVFFGAVQIKKNYVSFHLMPVYMFPDLLDDVSAALRKRMQGKSCFNFKRSEPDLLRELAELTRRGFARYEMERLV